MYDKPNLDNVISNVSLLEINNDYTNDLKINWDFEKSNHFIDVFKKSEQVTDDDVTNDFEYFGVIHSSTPEMKKVSPGMYIDSSKELYNMCEHVWTPFGECNVLLDDC